MKHKVPYEQIASMIFEFDSTKVESYCRFMSGDSNALSAFDKASQDRSLLLSACGWDDNSFDDELLRRLDWNWEDPIHIELMI